MFTRRKKTVLGDNVGSPQIASASSLHLVKGSDISARLRSKTMHMSMNVGRRNSTVLDAVSNDDLRILSKNINSHDETSRGSLTARARLNTSSTTEIVQSQVEARANEHNDEIDKLKRRMATMLEDLEDSDEDDLSDSPTMSSDNSFMDEPQRRSQTVGVMIPPLFAITGDDELGSPSSRIRSQSVFVHKRMSDSTFIPVPSPTTSSDRSRKKKFGSVVGDIRKSIMLRRQSVFQSPSSPIILDSYLERYGASQESPRRTNTEQRSIEYKDYASQDIVEAERKRLKDLRQFSPQLVLEGFHREGKLNDNYFRADLYFEKKDTKLVSFAKALSG